MPEENGQEFAQFISDVFPMDNVAAGLQSLQQRDANRYARGQLLRGFLGELGAWSGPADVFLAWMKSAVPEPYHSWLPDAQRVRNLIRERQWFDEQGWVGSIAAWLANDKTLRVVDTAAKTFPPTTEIGATHRCAFCGIGENLYTPRAFDVPAPLVQHYVSGGQSLFVHEQCRLYSNERGPVAYKQEEALAAAAAASEPVATRIVPAPGAVRLAHAEARRRREKRDRHLA